ncbi:redoxin family protein [Jannaschia aquimarina]|uniref:Putative peroxiredoxin n=1 Tax=Jannaschia aquimarina TaxID=935700 RepID=A0A0D1EMY7_9RHOB|nr:redoxin family protein [Jannaschia aquimarina]KIT17070.1 putative peroxiredoxin [Jannaschia aquimarina]SNS82733.1 Peroxiredoxin [Jannaschia aquimarina]
MAMGRRIPDVVLHTRVRDEAISPNPFRWAPIRAPELMGEGRVAVFLFPAAFSPTCSDSHLPAIEEAYRAFTEAGCRAVFGIAVNDAFTMHQWGRHLGIEKVALVPDGNGDFARRLGMLVSRRHLGYGFRAWRSAFVAEDGEIVAWFEEPGIGDDGGTDDDPYGETEPAKVLDWLEANPRDEAGGAGS